MPLVSLLLTVLILCLVLGIAWWAVQHVPLPEPFRWIVVVVFAIIAIILLLSVFPLGNLGQVRLR